MRESLVDRQVIAHTDSPVEYAILPEVVMVSLGGASIFDRGKSALLPLVQELAALDRAKHKIVVAVGGGARTRHTMSIALDLGLPTGGIAQLMGAMEEANVLLLNTLLAKHGSMILTHEGFWQLPLYLATGMLPITSSMPPYHFWEPPTDSESMVPMHGSDFGPFVHAETLGMKKVIYVKDENGLFDKDPKKHADAKHFRELTLSAVLKSPFAESSLDHQVFLTWARARHVEQIQIVNGLVPGTLTRALAGEAVGTVITKDVP